MLLTAPVGLLAAAGDDDGDDNNDDLDIAVRRRYTEHFLCCTYIRLQARRPTAVFCTHPPGDHEQKTFESRFVRGPPQCFVGMAGLVITVHYSGSAVERPSSAAMSRSKVLSPPQSSGVFSGKILRLMSPRVFLGKTPALLSPRGFSRRGIPGVAKAACDQNGDGAMKQGGDACKEGCDVDVATPTFPNASRANRESRTSKDKILGAGGLCKKIVPTMSSGASSA